MIGFELDNQLLVPSGYASASIGIDFAWTLKNWKTTITMGSFNLGTKSAHAQFKLITADSEYHIKTWDIWRNGRLCINWEVDFSDAGQ
jgi:hypothetical protein